MTKTIYLFDVDGTLTHGFSPIGSELIDCLKQLKFKGYNLGFVSGSNFTRITNQIGHLFELFNYMFPENGVISYKDGQLFHKKHISEQLPESILTSIIDYSLKYISELKLPVKRGNFIDYRTAIINICPCGRTVDFDQRQLFKAYDLEHGIRKDLQQKLIEKFGKHGLEFSIGGEISIDCYPTGWDKRYCLKFLQEFDQIHFFGDSTFQGGNDYTIYNDQRVIGHSVTCVNDTVKILKELLTQLDDSSQLQ
ncbi:phosphomannomutase [Babesia microti strain RI]|uniref:Phosphomannomutase n=1 Tax=Babesia microti (strain RI) TaxID=1133968 RepID=A0A1R4AC55_BABMR|nr:phosphomannomutase [Babesia microti strain RI]SJK86599.1 phosphomannomutase [Babesia microti strain RI]|eukprot:XP_021338738.1 phosphomannomutase [Babesia microti strain RI]